MVFGCCDHLNIQKVVDLEGAEGFTEYRVLLSHLFEHCNVSCVSSDVACKLGPHYLKAVEEQQAAEASGVTNDPTLQRLWPAVFHPGVLNREDHTWSCCQAKEGEFGCKPTLWCIGAGDAIVFS